jgi:hypothetical protein
MLEDAAEAANDCRLLAEATGLEQIASAAAANVAALKGPRHQRIEPIGPIQSRQSGWNLSVDPFALFVSGTDETMQKA